MDKRREKEREKGEGTVSRSAWRHKPSQPRLVEVEVTVGQRYAKKSLEREKQQEEDNHTYLKWAKNVVPKYTQTTPLPNCLAPGG